MMRTCQGNRTLACHVGQSDTRVSESCNPRPWLRFPDPTLEARAFSIQMKARPGCFETRRISSFDAEGIHFNLGRKVQRRVEASCQWKAAYQIVPLKFQARSCIQPADSVHTTIEFSGHAFERTMEEAANESLSFSPLS